MIERNGELKEIVVKFRLKVQISFVKQILKKISDLKKQMSWPCTQREVPTFSVS